MKMFLVSIRQMENVVHHVVCATWQKFLVGNLSCGRC